MSLKLHLSARSDELLAALRPALSAARATTLAASAGVPRPVPVLVPSAQLGDWLQVRLARDLGLSMGFEFLQPAAYFGRHVARDDAAAGFAEANAFWRPERIRWHLLPLLDGVARHLGQDTKTALTPRDRFAFAGMLARQFDRYARFRPDWPERWAGNQRAWSPSEPSLSNTAVEDEAWQRKLWRRVAGGDGVPPHPARLLRTLAGAGESAAVPPVFVVGTDLLDPLLIRTLDALARQGHAISLYLLLPSLGYLGDISRRNAARARFAAGVEPAIENGGHPLLASLGQQAVGTFLLIESLAPDYAQWPEFDMAPEEVPEDATLLQRLQADIRQQRPPARPHHAAGEPDPRPGFAADDRSLCVHCCHSPRRELEVLRDELLRAFADLPGLQPEEVMIAVTDFDTYAPLAEGILRAGLYPLPVRLTAVPAREANPIALALLALLRLSLGRQAASELVELLNLAAVQHHLDLAGETEMLAQLAEAIRQSGLTHGLEAERGGEGSGTWRAALDRHLAGSWFGPVADARDADDTLVHPLAADLPHHDEVLLRFAGWLTQLALHLHTWSGAAPAAVWAERLGKAVDDLLQSEAHDDHAAALRRLLGELAGVAALTPLDAGAMLDWLQPQLDNATSLRTSMGGEILLGRLDQVHGLPNRVLAILGLQDGAFPRAARQPAWDLLATRPQRWDGDPRTQDRQWFLDGLLTPADRLILSAANRSLRSPHDGPLSACVEEVLRVAADTVRPAAGDQTLAERIVVRHRIQPFATEYFTAGGRVPPSFDAGAARIAGDLAAAAAVPSRPFFSAGAKAAPPAADEVRTLTLGQLVAFWKDPTRAWLRAMQLEVAEDDADDRGLDDAPLNLDALQAYEVRATALDARVTTGPGVPATGARLAADRALPPGALGKLAWERYDREVEPMAVDLAPLLSEAGRSGLDLELPNGVRLTGEIRRAGGTTAESVVLVYRAGKYEGSPRHQLEAFIGTLAATVQSGRGTGCRVLGLDLAGPKQLPAIALDEARRCLARLVEGYWLGQRRPLGFAPACSHALAKELASGREEADALEKARAVWSKEPFRDQPGGEGTATAALLAWRDLDPFAPPHAHEWVRWARDVATPLSLWWNARPAAAGPAEAAPTPPRASRRKT